MKAVVEGELIISGNVKLVFGGTPMHTKIYVGKEGEWQQLKHVKGFHLSTFAGDAYHQLDIEVGVLNAEGDLLAKQEV